MALFNLGSLNLKGISDLNEDINFLINYKTNYKDFFSKIKNLNHKNEYSIGDLVYISTKNEGFWGRIILKDYNRLFYKVKIIDDIFIEKRFCKGEKIILNPVYFITYVSLKTKNKCIIV